MPAYPTNGNQGYNSLMRPKRPPNPNDPILRGVGGQGGGGMQGVGMGNTGGNPGMGGGNPTQLGGMGGMAGGGANRIGQGPPGQGGQYSQPQTTQHPFRAQAQQGPTGPQFQDRAQQNPMQQGNGTQLGGMGGMAGGSPMSQPNFQAQQNPMQPQYPMREQQYPFRERAPMGPMGPAQQGGGGAMGGGYGGGMAQDPTQGGGQTTPWQPQGPQFQAQQYPFGAQAPQGPTMPGGPGQYGQLVPQMMNGLF